MVASTDKGPNKTAFLTDFLGRNPRANPKAVNEAWAAAGRPGTVSTTLVNKLRAELGLAGNLRKSSAPEGLNGASGAGEPDGRKAPQRPKAKGAAKPKARAAEAHDRPAPPKKARSNERDEALAEVEGDIDRIIFKLMVVGGMMEVEDELRRIRRVLARSHQG